MQTLLFFQQKIQRSQAVQFKQCVSMQCEHPVVLDQKRRLDAHIAHDARLCRPYDCVVAVYI